MARLDYSTLPPEAQQAIQKLTGESHEELGGKQLKQTDSHTIKIGKSKPQTWKQLGYRVAMPLAFILIVYGIMWLVAFVTTMS
jgi:hypothetical protein